MRSSHLQLYKKTARGHVLVRRQPPGDSDVSLVPASARTSTTSAGLTLAVNYSMEIALARYNETGNRIGVFIAHNCLLVDVLTFPGGGISLQVPTRHSLDISSRPKKQRDQ